MMVHFAIADAEGNAVAVEYIANKMSVIETPIVTNFYLTPGEKYGVGTEESKQRYELLNGFLAEGHPADMEEMRDALDRVSKHNFDSAFASTEWSIVYDQYGLRSPVLSSGGFHSRMDILQQTANPCPKGGRFCINP